MAAKLTSGLMRAASKKIKQMPYKCVCFIFFLTTAAAALFLLIRAHHNDNANDFFDPVLANAAVNDPRLQHGDLICRSGVGFWSEYFRSHNDTDKRFSHIGVVIITADGKRSVIHAEANDFTGSGTVFQEPLYDFAGKALSIGVFRLKNVDASRFAAAAAKRLGTPFDWQFDLETSDRLFCTELIQTALLDAGSKIQLPVRRKYEFQLLPVDSCTGKEIADEICQIPDK